MQKPANPTPEEIRRISDLITAANTVGCKAVEFSRKRLDACLAIGEQFLEWKKMVGHGRWEAFANEHFPELPSSTRGRWQQLAIANRSGKFDLDACLGLRDAYIKAGILPEPPPKLKEGGCEEEPVSYLIHIARTQAALARIALDELSPEEAALLKERLRPIAALFDELTLILSTQHE